jgi:hypothetical protein
MSLFKKINEVKTFKDVLIWQNTMYFEIEIKKDSKLFLRKKHLDKTYN